MNTIKNYRTAARLVLGAAVAGHLLARPLASQAATYSFTDLNPSGLEYSRGYAISGSQQVGIGYRAGDSDFHALLWSGTASSAADLNPSGFIGSYCLGISGNQQVGYGWGPASGNFYHALSWSGRADSAMDMNPAGFGDSVGAATSGSQQVGYGVDSTSGGSTHALLWSGTPSGVVNLHPNRFAFSFAVGVCGGLQVGSGVGLEIHALLWSGTASSVVDLNPSGFTYSEGNGISGSQQVGFGRGPATGSNYHALLWSGTASNVVDLHPDGFTYSQGNGISGSQQVGFGYGPATGNNSHALLWSGSASSVVDLHSFLSSDYSDSLAAAIDTNGNIIGWATYIPTGQPHAILWTLLPESFVLCNDPGSCGAVATYSTGASVTCTPASGSLFPLGVTTVTCTATNPAAIYTFTVTVKDCEPPVVSCRPVHKPSDKKNAKPDKDFERDQDSDGFYQLRCHDNCDPNPRLYIQDSASGFLAGPFADGDIVQITKKHGRENSDDSNDGKNARPPIAAHIRLQGNGLLYGVDASGNVGASVLCSVPHGHDD